MNLMKKKLTNVLLCWRVVFHEGEAYWKKIQQKRCCTYVGFGEEAFQNVSPFALASRLGIAYYQEEKYFKKSFPVPTFFDSLLF